MQNTKTTVIIVSEILIVSAVLFGIWWWITPTDHTSHTTTEHTAHDMAVVSEREFLLKMIPHHQEAVMSAKLVLGRDSSATEVSAFAERIIANQEPEILEMQTWYQAWYGEVYTPSDSYQKMMLDLAQLDGQALDRAFLEDMIPHHQGAIEMAESVEPYPTHEEIRSLTQAIISTQASEIEEIRALLAAQ